MIMHEEFVGEAAAYLDDHPEVASGGGRIVERNVINEEFGIRNASLSAAAEHIQVVVRLDGGGVYRMAAVRPLGYFTDRNLNSFEELELAARLRNAGWKLARLNSPAVDHFGHRISGYNLLWRRLKSGYARAWRNPPFGDRHPALAIGDNRSRAYPPCDGGAVLVADPVGLRARRCSDGACLRGGCATSIPARASPLDFAWSLFLRVVERECARPGYWTFRTQDGPFRPPKGN
jgi:hypothetical protein